MQQWMTLRNTHTQIYMYIYINTSEIDYQVNSRSECIGELYLGVLVDQLRRVQHIVKFVV